MFFVWTFMKMLEGVTLAGKVGRVVDRSSTLADLHVQRLAREKRAREAAVDINHEYEKWQVKRYGRSTTRLPYAISPADLPHPAFHWACGDFVFTPEEWMLLGEWLQVRFHNAQHPEEPVQTAIDGHRLLQVGKARWAMRDVREEALTNAKTLS